MSDTQNSQGMERTKLLIACAITIGAAVLVITGTLIALNMRSSTPKVTDIVVSGEIACLPHKASSGPQTLECAIGLHTDDNRYFGLQDLPSAQAQQSAGTRINVHGVLTTGSDDVYDTAGTIKVVSATNN